MIRRALPWLLAGAIAVGAVGCGGDQAALAGETAPHTHTGLPAGDGTTSSYVGYTLADLRLPARSGVPGTYSFHIETYAKKPLTSYVTDLTKKMHVYLVTSDLAVYRHLHPTMAADGTWSGEVTLPQDGRYRLVTEFVTRGDGGVKDQLLLGAESTVGAPVARTPVPPPTTEGTADDLTVKILSAPSTGFEHRMRIGFAKDGTAASLGSYLGVYAHISAFDVRTGALVHMHPLGGPVVRGGYAVLDFHTSFEQPGDYRMFVQTRVSGLVRTLPITVLVTGQPVPAP